VTPDRQPLAVLRMPADPQLWAVHSVDPMGGVGPRCADIQSSREAAEALAQAIGLLTEPHDEAA
jgi:hypothetical protein